MPTNALVSMCVDEDRRRLANRHQRDIALAQIGRLHLKAVGVGQGRASAAAEHMLKTGKPLRN